MYSSVYLFLTKKPFQVYETNLDKISNLALRLEKFHHVTNFEAPCHVSQKLQETQN